MQTQPFDFNKEHELRAKYTCHNRAMGTVYKGQPIVDCASDVQFTIDTIDEETIEEMIAKNTKLFSRKQVENKPSAPNK